MTALPEPERSLQHMKDPLLWMAHHPLLPVKRGDPRDPECAIMIAVEDCPTTVFLTNLFFASGRNLQDLIESEVQRICYASYEAVVADGWRVD